MNQRHAGMCGKASITNQVYNGSMRITKFEHACLSIEKDDQNLIIDPGDITDDFVVPPHVVGIVLTHEHSDHVDPVKIQAILETNPEATVISHAGIIGTSAWHNTNIVQPGDTITVGNFSLSFFGGKHEVIHTTIPVVDNIGVMVDDVLYYPGDSYALPGRLVEVLAVPTSGPWLKIGDVADFVKAIHPRIAFSTHDAHSSVKNTGLVDRLLPGIVADETIRYMRLSAPLEV